MKQDNRKYQRLANECRVEYCLLIKEGLRGSSLNDLSGGGAYFYASEKYDNGTKPYLKIYVPGWSYNDGDLQQALDTAAEVMLETIAEFIHTESGDNNVNFLIGTRFLGKVNM